jgi:hypothetical protein
MLAGCEGRKRDRRHRGGAQRRRPSLTLNTGRCLTLGSFRPRPLSHTIFPLAPCDIDITCPLAPCDITMHHLSPHTLRQRLSSGQLVRNQPVGQLIAGALAGDLGESMQFDVGSPYRKHSVNTSGVTCSSFGDTEPTENECKEGWEQLRLSTNTTSGASWSGSTSYSFMPNGCVVNTGTGIAHDGTVYFNSGAGAGPYSGRSLICKLANEQAPFTQGSFDSQVLSLG